MKNKSSLELWLMVKGVEKPKLEILQELAGRLENAVTKRTRTWKLEDFGNSSLFANFYENEGKLRVDLYSPKYTVLYGLQNTRPRVFTPEHGFGLLVTGDRVWRACYSPLELQFGVAHEPKWEQFRRLAYLILE